MNDPLGRLSPEQLTVIRARMEAGDHRPDDVTALFGHLAELGRDNADAEALNNRMARILRETADALKGGPDPMTSHSWHDLPQTAAAWKNRAEAAECLTEVLPCVEVHEPPFDFKSCVTHDRTFALDGSCGYAGKSVVTYLEDEVTAQRMRAIRAEDRAAEAEAASTYPETSTR